MVSSFYNTPFNGYTPENEMIEVAGGVIKLGKALDDSTYGWDIDYGDRTIKVAPFLVSKYLITNANFIYFVKAGGYKNQEYWDEESWNWKTRYNIQCPKFWLHENGSYKYRAMFDEILSHLLVMTLKKHNSNFGNKCCVILTDSTLQIISKIKANDVC